jgi:hypothetical protein
MREDLYKTIKQRIKTLSRAQLCYKRIYKYDSMTQDFKIATRLPAKFKSGLFDASFFFEPVDIPFEDAVLLGSSASLST